MVKSEDFLPAASGLDGIEWTEDTPKLILSYGDAAAERPFGSDRRLPERCPGCPGDPYRG